MDPSVSDVSSDADDTNDASLHSSADVATDAEADAEAYAEADVETEATNAAASDDASIEASDEATDASETTAPSSAPPDCVLDYAHNVIALKIREQAYTEFRKPQLEIQKQHGDALVNYMLEQGAKMRRLNVNGEEVVVKLETRYLTSKMTDSVLHKGLLDVLVLDAAGDDDDEAADFDVAEAVDSTVVPLPTDEDELQSFCTNIYKGIQRARTTRKNCIKYVPAAKVSRRPDVVEDEIKEDAVQYVRASALLKQAREQSKRVLTPLRQALSTAESSIINSIPDKKHRFSMSFEDGSTNTVTVSKRENKKRKRAETAVPRLKTAVIKQAITAAVNSLAETSTTTSFNSLYAAIKQRISDTTKALMDAAAEAEPSKKTSLVVRMKKAAV